MRKQNATRDRKNDVSVRKLHPHQTQTASSAEINMSAYNFDPQAGDLFLPKNSIEDNHGFATTQLHATDRIGGAKVNITLEYPTDPANILRPEPIGLVHGYMGPEEAYAGQRSAMAQNGNVVFTYGSPRRQQGFGELHWKHIGKPERLLGQAAWAGMRSSLELATKHGIPISDLFHLIGHSMGGPTISDVALHHHRHVKSVIYHQPAGFENHDLLTLIFRIPSFASQELPHTNKSMILGAIKYGAANPLKTACEGIGVTQRDVRKHAQALSRLGITTGILIGNADTLISARKTAEHGRVVDVFSVYKDPSADHTFGQRQPKIAAQALEELIDAMQASSSKPTVSSPPLTQAA